MSSDNSNMLDPIILGHNQFFGTNHLSATKGIEKERHFNDLSRVKEIIEFSVSNGVNGLMLSTHPMAPKIIEILKNDKNLNDINIYPLLPYINKYVKGANEKGIINLIQDTLSLGTIGNKFKVVFKGGTGIVRKDIYSLLRALIDTELMPFNDTNIKAIFLHDVLTDLALAYSLPDIFQFFESYIKTNYSAIPAYATKNLPALLYNLKKWGIECPVVMASINKLGFQVNPSLKIFESSITKYNFNLVAMSTLSSGAIKPSEAYKYISKLPNLSSIVVGVSTEKHAKDTFSIIRKEIQ